MGKSEAANLLSTVEVRLASNEAQLAIDFQKIDNIGDSGARVLFYGLVRRFGEAVFDRITVLNVPPELVATLESAVEDALSQNVKT